LLLFAQLVVFSMTTFWAYQTGHVFGFQKGADHVYEEFKGISGKLGLH